MKTLDNLTHDALEDTLSRHQPNWPYEMASQQDLLDAMKCEDRTAQRALLIRRATPKISMILHAAYCTLID